jgi:hypothetical protein
LKNQKRTHLSLKKFNYAQRKVRMKNVVVISIVLMILSVCCAEVNNSQVSNGNVKRISLEISSCNWFTKLNHAPKMDFGHVMLFIKGKTNAERVTVLTYGDGLRADIPLIIHPNGTFADTINISFAPLQYGTDLTRTIYSVTILKAYLESEKFDTTLHSGKLHYE